MNSPIGYKTWRGVVFAAILLVFVSATLKCTAGEKTPLSATNEISVLRAMVQEEETPNKGVITGYNKSVVLGRVTSIERTIERGDLVAAGKELESLYGHNPPDKILAQLKKTLQAIDEETQHQTEEMINQAKNLLSGLPNTCLGTTNNENIAVFIDQVSSLRAKLERCQSEYAASRIQIMRNNLSNAEGFIRTYAEVIQYEKTKDHAKALERIDRILSNPSYSVVCPTESLQDKKNSLTKEINGMVDEKLAEIRNQLLKADTLEAVEKINGDLRALYEKFPNMRRGGVERGMLEKSQQAISAWMTVVSAEQEGDVQKALQMLASLERPEFKNTSLISPKEISAKKSLLLRKMLDEKPVSDSATIQIIDEKMKTVQSLDDLLNLTDKIQMLGSFSYGGSLDTKEISALVADLQSLAEASQSLETGRLRDTGSSYHMSKHRWRGITDQYRKTILLKKIETACRLSSLEFENKDQTVSELLLSLADKAFEKKDWNRVCDILDAYRLCVSEPTWLNAELAGCRSFLLGQKLEAAGLYAEAVKAYIDVLRNASRRTPTEDALNCLKKLKKEHPESEIGGISKQ